jgi:hypothetical protein
MPVNFLHLKPQIQALAESAVTRRSELVKKLAACESLLKQYQNDLILLQKTVEEAAAQNKGLRCAVPVDESLTAHLPAILPAPACTILAADGSQINPDPHGEALFGLVNVGVFRMQPGSGEAPGIKTFSDLLYDDSLQSSNGLASEDLIALLRDVREREILAEMAQNELAPLVTLTDGPLELYHEPRQEKSFERYFKSYLAALDKLALNRVITAGYVDRPRADLVVKMLELLVPEDETIDRPFAGVNDLNLFEKILNPGERSAIFKLQSSSADAFEGKKALHFFYLNVGSVDRPSLARVEAPLWVIENKQTLSLLQSVLVEQSQQAGSRPYPYPLLRAHEIAVVKMTDHDQITTLIEAEMLKRGLPPGLNSNKQSHKQHQGRGRM